MTAAGEDGLPAPPPILGSAAGEGSLGLRLRASVSVTAGEEEAAGASLNQDAEPAGVRELSSAVPSLRQPTCPFSARPRSSAEFLRGRVALCCAPGQWESQAGPSRSPRGCLGSPAPPLVGELLPASLSSSSSSLFHNCCANGGRSVPPRRMPPVGRRGLTSWPMSPPGPGAGPPLRGGRAASSSLCPGTQLCRLQGGQGVASSLPGNRRRCQSKPPPN